MTGANHAGGGGGGSGMGDFGMPVGVDGADAGMLFMPNIVSILGRQPNAICLESSTRVGTRTYG